MTLLVVLLLCCALPAQGGPRYHDYMVVGAGPAGLQMGHFLEKAGRDYVILERGNTSGTFFTLYPRHDKLISINKRNTGKLNKDFNLRHDWNSLISDDDSLLFKHYSREFFPDRRDLVRYLADYENKLGLKVQYNTEVSNIERQLCEESGENVYSMEDQHGNTYTARALIMATGMWRANTPEVPGVDLLTDYQTMSLDPEDYEGKSVLILGRGNTAFEVANSIYGHTSLVHMIGRGRQRLAWATHYIGDLRAVNNELLDTYQLKSLDGLLEQNVKNMGFEKENGKIKIKFPQEEDDFTDFDNSPFRDGYDAIIQCLGWKFDFGVFSNMSQPYTQYTKSRAAKRASKYPTIDHGYESRLSPDLFFAGTNTHSLDWRKSAGGFIHGFRYTARALYRLLAWRYHQEAWPTTTHPASHLTDMIVERANQASGTYQMFSVLADVICFVNEGQDVQMYTEYPVRLLHELPQRAGHACDGPLIVLVSEYGRNFSGPNNDVFRADRAVGNPEIAHHSSFLHPRLYYYKQLPTEAEMNAELPRDEILPKPDRLHVMLEDFLATWDAKETHLMHLRRFLDTVRQADTREWFAGTCLKMALLRRTVADGCLDYVMRGHGLLAS